MGSEDGNRGSIARWTKLLWIGIAFNGIQFAIEDVLRDSSVPRNLALSTDSLVETGYSWIPFPTKRRWVEWLTGVRRDRSLCKMG